jgi:hypothetical protein
MGWSWNRQNHPQSGRYGPEKLSFAARATELRWGPFLPVPSTGTRRAPLGKGDKPPCRAGNCWGLESPGGLPAGEANPPSRYTKAGDLGALASL